VDPPTPVLVHYHLRPGGVTRVIETVSRQLTRAGIPHRILAGTPSQDPSLPVTVLPALDYGANGARDFLGPLLTQAAPAPPRLWHFHNPALGKVPELSAALADLAHRGEPILFQHHDFAEDGRPDNFRALDGIDALYPHADHARHATINSRDRDHLLAAGLPAERTLLLPNPVTPPATIPPPPGGPPRVLYPVRGILRKNLGETLLLATHAPPAARFAIALSPTNPRWQPSHDRWAALADELGLQLDFDVVERLAPAPGADRDYPGWLARSTHCLTTSVAEGFGLALLEPATLGRPLVGRRIPWIDRDLAAAGIRAGRFYDRLLVPPDWIDPAAVARELDQARRDDLAAYGRPHRPLDPPDLDFARLPPTWQERVIRRARTDPAAIEVEADGHHQPLATWLASTLDQRQPTLAPDALGPYAPDAAIVTLLDAYRQLATAEPGPVATLDRQRLLDAFLTDFHILCR